MRTPSISKTPRSAAIKRGPGRPATRGNGSFSKNSVFERALRLCKHEPLQTISIVRISSELNVTPALIHYYVGGRDRLTSGVMNRFYEELVGKLPPPVADWRADLSALFGVIYATYLDFGGIVAYVMSHNRFRLFQLVEGKEKDYGAQFFERTVASVRLAGLSAERTAMFTHLLLQHVLSSAYQQASHQLPEDHHDFLLFRMKKASLKSTPNTHFIVQSFAALRGDDAYKEGLTIILDAINRYRSHPASRRRIASE
jgi:AcrR family transcriptional regulator